MPRSKSRLGESAGASLIIRPRGLSRVRAGGIWRVECIDLLGNVKWTDESHNIVVNVGLTYLIGVALLTTTQIPLTSWFVGLISSTPTIAAADSMSAHAGWTDNVTYSNATRPAWSGVAGSTGSASNSAAPAVFNINGTSTIGGCFLTSVSTKSGTTGTLYSGVAFTGGDRAVVNTDTMNVTYNHSVADDGV